MAGPLKSRRNCVECNQEFQPTNWKQRRCKSCGPPAEATRRREWQRAYYRANAAAFNAKARAKYMLRKLEGADRVPHRRGHPYCPPKDSTICLRCGADIMPMNANQKFCSPCKPLAAQELGRANDKAYRQRFRDKVWHLVFGHYSSGSFACACCGESEPDFLTLDHINNDGGRQRKMTDIGGGNRFYYWLLRNGFPPGIQVYCSNCNSSKGKHGECVHKIRVPTAPPLTLEHWVC